MKLYIFRDGDKQEAVLYIALASSAEEALKVIEHDLVAIYHPSVQAEAMAKLRTITPLTADRAVEIYQQGDFDFGTTRLKP